MAGKRGRRRSRPEATVVAYMKVEEKATLKEASRRAGMTLRKRLFTAGIERAKNFFREQRQCERCAARRAEEERRLNCCGGR